MVVPNFETVLAVSVHLCESLKQCIEFACLQSHFPVAVLQRFDKAEF